TRSGDNATDTRSGDNATDTRSGDNATDTRSGDNATDTGSDINVINRAGFLVVVTNVINDDNGVKTSQDFRVHILNSSALPSSFKGSPSPNGQIVAVEEGIYTVGVSNTDGYDVDFQYDCSGFINERDIKVCSINLNDMTFSTPDTGTGDGGSDTGTGDGGSDTGTGDGGSDTGTGDGGSDTGTGNDTRSPSTFNDFTIAAAGDWGCNSNSRDTASSILSTSPEIVLGLGDYSYKSNGLCWLDVISAINDQMKISIGNHDGEPKEDEKLTEDYLEHFFSDIFEDDRRQYHSFIFENVFFIAMATDISYSVGSSQHNFVIQELEKASEDENIDWIVVYYHRPTYSSPTKHAGLTEFRNIYHPLFDKYNVDLVLAGHNHNYQRTYPITYNPSDPSDPVLASTETNTYTNIQSPIFITAGTGGVSLYNLKGQADFTVEQQERYGHLNLDVINSNGKKIVGKFIDNDGDELDQFTIIKSNASSLSIDNNIDDNTLTSLNNTEVDIFGVQKIYPSKVGGEEWFMDMVDPTSDSRLELRGEVDKIVKSTNGSDVDFDWTDVDDNFDYAWTPIPTDKVRLVAYTSDSRYDCDSSSQCAKFDETNMQDFLTTKDNRQIYNLTKLSEVGHWFSDRDWTNIEMTGYFKVLSTEDDNKGFSIFSRSIGHDSEISGCGGATPKFHIGYDGELEMKKEMWHVSQIRDDSINDNDLSPSIEGKWLGIKTVIYNLPDNQGVKMETWLDKNNNGEFEKVHEFLETSGFGEKGTIGPEKCSGTWDQLYTWGSPKAVWHWDDSVSLFKFLSVREIVPPSNN
ncbi:MAG: metallophosphoesterase, partial [Nitrososphaeraceae archaeon]